MPKPRTNRPGQGDELDEFTKRLSNRKAGYQAAHVRLSMLPPTSAWDAVRWVAEKTFGRIMRTYDDEMFRLANGDLVLLCRDKDSEAMYSAIDSIYALARTDLKLADGGIECFATRYDLSTSWQQFMDQVEPLFERKPDLSKSGREDKAHQPIDADHLNTLEETLRAVDLSNFVRRQTICAVTGNSPPEPVYDELYLSVAMLQEEVMPDIDLAGNRLLFSQLTTTFDSRMLSIISTNGNGYLAGPCSLNLNISTILSKEFLEITEQLGVGHEQTLVVELHIGDVFRNTREFALAREVAQEVGFLLCLDGIDGNSLSWLDLPSLGFKLYKLHWRDEMLHLPPEDIDQLRSEVIRVGPERMILCRCDDETALEFGRGIGIRLFQGWHTDRALRAPAARREPLEADPV